MGWARPIAAGTRSAQADRHFAKLIDFHSYSQEVREESLEAVLSLSSHGATGIDTQGVLDGYSAFLLGSPPARIWTTCSKGTPGYSTVPYRVNPWGTLGTQQYPIGATCGVLAAALESPPQIRLRGP